MCDEEKDNSLPTYQLLQDGTKQTEEGDNAANPSHNPAYQPVIVQPISSSLPITQSTQPMTTSTQPMSTSTQPMSTSTQPMNTSPQHSGMYQNNSQQYNNQQPQHSLYGQVQSNPNQYQNQNQNQNQNQYQNQNQNQQNFNNNQNNNMQYQQNNTYQPPNPVYNQPGVYGHHQQQTHTTVTTVHGIPQPPQRTNLVLINQGLEPNVCGNSIPILDPGTAMVILILNIFFPGIGTMVCGCVGRNANPCGWFMIGFLQIILIFCLIGWIWSIITGIQVMHRSNEPRTVTLL